MLLKAFAIGVFVGALFFFAVADQRGESGDTLFCKLLCERKVAGSKGVTENGECTCRVDAARLNQETP